MLEYHQRLKLYRIEDYLRKIYKECSIDTEEYFRAFHILHSILYVQCVDCKYRPLEEYLKG